MDRTLVTCTETDNVVEADILNKSSRYLKVVIDGSNEPIELYKDTPNARIYVGYLFGMEFTSEGN